jgi:hypothetical protein
MMNSPIDNGRQTDATIARRSERDQVRLTCQLPLCNVMVCHFSCKKCTIHLCAPNNDQFFILMQLRLGKRLPMEWNSKWLEKESNFEKFEIVEHGRLSHIINKKASHGLSVRDWVEKFPANEELISNR